MAQQGEALVTRSVALPPRYEKLLELEPSGGSRCQLAIDLGNDPGKATRRLVAVHSAPPAVSEDDELRAQFAERAAAFLPLRHPNLVSTFEAVSERGRCYWVTEFVPGQPLPVLLKQARRGRRALSTRKILGILRDVAHALEHAHGAVDAAGCRAPSCTATCAPPACD